MTMPTGSAFPVLVHCLPRSPIYRPLWCLHNCIAILQPLILIVVWKPADSFTDVFISSQHKQIQIASEEYTYALTILYTKQGRSNKNPTERSSSHFLLLAMKQDDY